MAAKTSRVVRVVVITIITIGTVVFLYLLINNFQFLRGTMVRVHFETIGDLNTGAWVRRAGLKVGSVTNVELAPDQKSVIVTLTLRPGQVARQADQFKLVSKGILGDVFIEQVPGPKDSPPVPSGQMFEGQAAFSLNDVLGGSAIDAINQVVDSIKSVADIIKNNQETLNQTIKDFQVSVANTREITENVAVASRDMPKIMAQVTSTLDDLERSVNHLSKAVDGVSTKLETEISSGADDLSASLKTVRKASSDIQGIITDLSGKGSVISTLSSPATSRSVEVTLKNLQEMSAALLKATQDAQKLLENVGGLFK